jgi:putative hydrolase of the HAD superfamily
VANHSLSKIKAIVFDLDDTLYPQISYKRSGFTVVAQWLASHLNLNQSDILSGLEEILALYGPSYPYMFDRLAERFSLGDSFVPEMVRRFIDHEPQIRCYEGVIPMLARLKNKYRLGILTDGRFTVQQKKIFALGLKDRVDEILFSDAMGLEKPAAELFQWFEDAFRLNGENLMYVGDNPQKDFYGANCRGWRTVMVKTGAPLPASIPAGYEPKVEIPTVEDLEARLRHEPDGDDHFQVSNERHGVYS